MKKAEVKGYKKFEVNGFVVNEFNTKKGGRILINLGTRPKEGIEEWVRNNYNVNKMKVTPMSEDITMLWFSFK